MQVLLYYKLATSIILKFAILIKIVLISPTGIGLSFEHVYLIACILLC